MSMKGLLFVISGPSGVGKGSICHQLLAKNPQLHYSVSATTREPRKGEEEGINYFFLNKADFLDKIQKQEFLEWAEVYGNYYGTLQSKVQALRAAGQDVILEIDTQGAMQVKAACPEGIFIFILPPALEELTKRIRKRGSETPESLLRRTSKAEGEIAMASEYDYTVINDDLEQAVAELEGIIHREKTGQGKAGLMGILKEEEGH